MESRKERSIVFNRTDVDAILDGRKTQFRKIIKPQPNTDNEGNIRWRGWTYVQDTNGGSPHFDSIIDIPGSPFGKIGDILIKYGSLKDNSPRITLEIIDVRVERLHDTTEEDAIKEGIISTYQHDGNTSLKSKKMFKAFPEKDGWFDDCIEAYKAYWNKSNRKYPWGTPPWNWGNPWVWVVEFRKLGVMK